MRNWEFLKKKQKEHCMSDKSCLVKFSIISELCYKSRKNYT